MLSIKVLGPGCKNCELLAQHARQAVERVLAVHPNVEVNVEKVTDVRIFANYGLLVTPGLVVNERLVSSGRIPSQSQIQAWLEDVLLHEG